MPELPQDDPQRKGQAEGESAGIEQKRIPRDWSPISDCLNLRTGGRRTLYITAGTLHATGIKGKGATEELINTVQDTIRGTDFASGWRGVTDYDTEEGDENWEVYVAIPGYLYDRAGQRKLNKRKGELFLVFVDGDGVIRDWFWDDADPNNPKFPVGHDRQRFREQAL